MTGGLGIDFARRRRLPAGLRGQRLRGGEGWTGGGLDQRQLATARGSEEEGREGRVRTWQDRVSKDDKRERGGRVG